ncbi:NFACT family protein [Candidatus Micrarchaeota archaeon]|nr:NFACT family protein [Candidatus Micrarchaeota archaeon]
MGDAVSSHVVALLAKELNDALAGKHLQKIQQVGENTFKATFSAPKIDVIIEPGRRMHVTNYDVTAPEKASQISMFLRKHIGGKRVERVYQHENDRIIVFDFNGFLLITEFFSHGNFVLVDGAGVIQFTFRKEEWKDRKIAKGEKYLFPSNAGGKIKEVFSPITKEDVEKKGVNSALDDFYSSIRVENPKVTKLKNRLAAQEASFSEFQRLADDERTKGDLLYSNYAEVGKIIELGSCKSGSKVKGKRVSLDLN